MKLFMTSISKHIIHVGLLIGHRKKLNFMEFSETNLQKKTANFKRKFIEVFGPNFAEKQSVKNGRFRENFLGIFCWKAITFALI